MLHLRLELAAILLIILDASIKPIAALSRKPINDKLLRMAASERDVDLALKNEEDAIEIVALVVDQVILRIEELLHLVS